MMASVMMMIKSTTYTCINEETNKRDLSMKPHNRNTNLLYTMNIQLDENRFPLAGVSRKIL